MEISELRAALGVFKHETNRSLDILNRAVSDLQDDPSSSFVRRILQEKKLDEAKLYAIEEAIAEIMDTLHKNNLKKNLCPHCMQELPEDN